MRLIIAIITASAALFVISGILASAEDEGWDLATTKCVACHTFDRVKAKRQSEDDWRTLVKRMQGKKAGWISDDEADKIIAALSQKFPPDDPPESPAAPTAHAAAQTAASAPAETPEKSGEENDRWALSEIFNPAKLLGMLTASLLTITFIMGFYIKRHYKKIFPLHRLFAYLTIFSAVVHAAYVLFIMD